MTQDKNSLGSDDLPSIAYELESVVVDTEEGPTDVGRFSILGLSDRTVGEVLSDNAKSADEMDDRYDAASFIEGYLTEHDGEALAKDVIKAGKDAGYMTRTLQNARKKVASTERRGFGAGGGAVWRLSHTSRSGSKTHINGTYGTDGVTKSSIHPIHPIDHALSEVGTNGGPRIKSPRK